MTRTLTKFEKNSLRKSYRTTVPLFVIINNHYYSTLDWSLTGFSVKDFAEELAVEEIVEGQLLIQLEEASIAIPVEMRLVYNNNERAGFEFKQLSEKNKKVLKRFIEYAVEGKLTHTNNFISIYEEPEIKTPINVPVKLETEEYNALNRAFHFHSLRYIIFALLVLGTLGFLLFSQFRYSYKGSGIVVGNYQNIYPKVQATLEKLYFQEGDTVKPGDMLAQFNTEDARYQITLLEAEKKHFIENRKDQIAKDELVFSKEENKELQKFLTQQIKELKKLYQNAKIQFKNHLITALEYSKIKSRYFDAKLKFQYNKLKNIQLKNRLEKNLDNTQNFDIKIEHAKELLKNYNLSAPVAGKIYEIYGIEGEVLQINRPVLSIWTKKRPLIEVNVPQSKISQINMNAKVDIIDNINHQEYEATVVKIGSVDDEKYIKVTLKPKGDTSQLRPNQRVSVLFKRSFQDVF